MRKNRHALGADFGLEPAHRLCGIECATQCDQSVYGHLFQLQLVASSFNNDRHCERSEAIHRAAWTEWIASSLSLLAMTVKSVEFRPRPLPAPASRNSRRVPDVW